MGEHGGDRTEQVDKKKNVNLKQNKLKNLLDVDPVNENGKSRVDKKKNVNSTKTAGGNAKDYRLGKLKRDFGDAVDKFIKETGETNVSAIERHFGVKKDDGMSRDFKMALSYFKKLSDEEKSKVVALAAKN